MHKTKKNNGHISYSFVGALTSKKPYTPYKRYDIIKSECKGIEYYENNFKITCKSNKFHMYYHSFNIGGSNKSGSRSYAIGDYFTYDMDEKNMCLMLIIPEYDNNKSDKYLNHNIFFNEKGWSNLTKLFKFMNLPKQRLKPPTM